jgi:hypothetical protein
VYEVRFWPIPVLLLRDEPVDKEVALLVEEIVEEVAVIGVLCDTLAIGWRASPAGSTVSGEREPRRAEPPRARSDRLPEKTRPMPP